MGCSAYAEPHPSGPTIAASWRSTTPITVVIADDHRSFAEAMQIALDKENDLTVIEVVDDGEMAITETLERQPDVVLMDLRMPGTDGIEATRRIRTEGGRSAIVILTGEGDDVSLARAIQAGARGMLAKTSAIGDVVTRRAPGLPGRAAAQARGGQPGAARRARALGAGPRPPTPDRAAHPA